MGCKTAATNHGNHTMQVLNFPIDNFDQVNTFAFEYKGFRGNPVQATGYIFHDDEKDVMYIMKKSACLKSHYTKEDDAERLRLNTMTPVRHGDIVEVSGKQYRVQILGNYSDAGRLIPV
jgi:hypothetical protein